MGLAVTKQEAFWEACGYGRIFEVKKMLETGTINVNWKSYTHDCCPIHVASQGKKEIVELLLAAKCDVNVRDDRENLAIHHAAMKGHADIIQLLLDAGSKIDAEDKVGWTPLIVASYWCHPQVCSLLVRNKCNVHLKNRDTRTALHEVCRSPVTDRPDELAEIATLLVECGCDLDTKNTGQFQADFTPLMFCAYHGHAKVAKVLIDADCKISDQAANGWSALHWAADRGHLEVVKVLLHGGIDVYLKGTRGELALDRSGDNEIQELICEAMQLNGTEHKIAMETRGSLMKNLYIPTAGAQCNYNPGETDLSTSPRSPNVDVDSSPMFQSMKAQMVSLSDQHKNKKTRRVERKISQRIFEPPKPPAEVNPAPSAEDHSESPVISIHDEPIGFMDDQEGEQEEESDLDRDQSVNTISNSQSNGLISNQSFSSTENNGVSENGGLESQTAEKMPSHEEKVLSHESTSATTITTTCQESVSRNTGQSEESNTEGSDSKASVLKNGVDNFEQLNGKVNEVLNQKHPEYFDENEIDGEGFSDDMLN